MLETGKEAVAIVLELATYIQRSSKEKRAANIPPSQNKPVLEQSRLTNVLQSDAEQPSQAG